MSTTTVPLVDLAAQYQAIKGDIDAAIARVIANTSFILGPEVQAFEEAFAAYCRVGSCVGCGNGTDAVSLALQGLGVRPGDEVITVSFTFIASAEAITAIGAKPVFVDVCPNTLVMDVSKVEAAITPQTSAILPVHLYGQVVDMDSLLEIACHYGLKVVEDAAQAHGALYKGRRAGSMGDAAAFSFYPGKNLGAYGDAGAVVTNDPGVADWVAKARNHGRAAKYEHEFEARNSRMDGVQGAILNTKLDHLDTWNENRRKLAAEYDRLLADIPGVTPVSVDPRCQSVYHLYVVRVSDRDAVLSRLHKAGVEAGIHYPIPLHLQKAYAYLDPREGALPVTDTVAAEVLSLPLYPELDFDTVQMCSNRLRECLS